MRILLFVGLCLLGKVLYSQSSPTATMQEAYRLFDQGHEQEAVILASHAYRQDSSLVLLFDQLYEKVGNVGRWLPSTVTHPWKTSLFQTRQDMAIYKDGHELEWGTQTFVPSPKNLIFNNLEAKAGVGFFWVKNGKRKQLWSVRDSLRLRKVKIGKTSYDMPQRQLAYVQRDSKRNRFYLISHQDKRASYFWENEAHRQGRSGQVQRSSQLACWDANTGELLWERELEGNLQSFRYSETDERLLLLIRKDKKGINENVSDREAKSYAASYTLELYDTDGKALKTLLRFEQGADDARFAPVQYLDFRNNQLMEEPSSSLPNYIFFSSDIAPQYSYCWTLDGEAAFFKIEKGKRTAALADQDAVPVVAMGQALNSHYMARLTNGQRDPYWAQELITLDATGTFRAYSDALVPYADERFDIPRRLEAYKKKIVADTLNRPLVEYSSFRILGVPRSYWTNLQAFFVVSSEEVLCIDEQGEAKLWRLDWDLPFSYAPPLSRFKIPKKVSSLMYDYKNRLLTGPLPNSIWVWRIQQQETESIYLNEIPLSDGIIGGARTPDDLLAVEESGLRLPFEKLQENLAANNKQSYWQAYSPDQSLRAYPPSGNLINVQTGDTLCALRIPNLKVPATINNSDFYSKPWRFGKDLMLDNDFYLLKNRLYFSYWTTDTVVQGIRGENVQRTADGKSLLYYQPNKKQLKRLALPSGKLLESIELPFEDYHDHVETENGSLVVATERGALWKRTKTDWKQLQAAQIAQVHQTAFLDLELAPNGQLYCISSEALRTYDLEGNLLWQYALPFDQLRDYCVNPKTGDWALLSGTRQLIWGDARGQLQAKRQLSEQTQHLVNFLPAQQALLCATNNRYSLLFHPRKRSQTLLDRHRLLEALPIEIYGKYCLDADYLIDATYFLPFQLLARKDHERIHKVAEKYLSPKDLHRYYEKVFSILNEAGLRDADAALNYWWLYLRHPEWKPDVKLLENHVSGLALYGLLRSVENSSTPQQLLDAYRLLHSYHPYPWVSLKIWEQQLRLGQDLDEKLFASLENSLPKGAVDTFLRSGYGGLVQPYRREIGTSWVGHAGSWVQKRLEQGKAAQIRDLLNGLSDYYREKPQPPLRLLMDTWNRMQAIEKGGELPKEYDRYDFAYISMFMAHAEALGWTTAQIPHYLNSTSFSAYKNPIGTAWGSRLTIFNRALKVLQPTQLDNFSADLGWAGLYPRSYEEPQAQLELAIIDSLEQRYGYLVFRAFKQLQAYRQGQTDTKQLLETSKRVFEMAEPIKDSIAYDYYTPDAEGYVFLLTLLERGCYQAWKNKDFEAAGELLYNAAAYFYYVQTLHEGPVRGLALKARSTCLALLEIQAVLTDTEPKELYFETVNEEDLQMYADAYLQAGILRPEQREQLR